MSRRSLYTALLLGFIVIGLVVLLFREAASGPIFRAGDHATFEECVANIPIEWPRGSIEYTGAEAACHYQHRAQQSPGRGG
jgi:hypothetical protein